MPEEICECYCLVSWGAPSTPAFVPTGPFSVPVVAGGTQTRSRPGIINWKATIRKKEYTCISHNITNTTDSVVDLNHHTATETQTSARVRRVLIFRIWGRTFRITLPLWGPWSPWTPGFFTSGPVFTNAQALTRGGHTPLCSNEGITCP